MFHRPECQKYKQWKLEQARKSKPQKKKVKKSQERELIADCLDDEQTQSPEVLQKSDSPKCKEKRRRGGRRRRRKRMKSLSGVVIKQISLTEVYLKKIKPSVEVRERLLNPRHMACLYDTASESDITIIIDELTRRSLASEMRATGDRRRACIAKAQRKRKPRKSSKQRKGMKRKVEDEPGDESKAEAPKGKPIQKTKGRPKRKQVKRKVVTRERDSDSEDSECDSICSFDSEVCLAGIKITAKDKKQLKALAQETSN